MHKNRLQDTKIAIVKHVMYCMQGSEPNLSFKEASIACKKAALKPIDFECIKLVYGEAGMLLL